MFRAARDELRSAEDAEEAEDGGRVWGQVPAHSRADIEPPAAVPGPRETGK